MEMTVHVTMASKNRLFCWNAIYSGAPAEICVFHGAVKPGYLQRTCT